MFPIRMERLQVWLFLGIVLLRLPSALSDACAAQPCQNGGSCEVSADAYTCTCLEGYGGTNCTTVASCTDQDTEVSCQLRQSEKLCDSTTDLSTFQSCQFTCNACPWMDCVDLHTRCQEWYKNGECILNPFYMSYYCQKSCHTCPDCQEPAALGMEGLQIFNFQINTSSDRDAELTGAMARLNGPSCWIRSQTDAEPWLQVDFLWPVTLIKILTQGRPTANNQWVEKYKVSFSKAGLFFRYHRQFDGQVKVFSGNFDRLSAVEQYLWPNIVARFVRIHPQTWNIRPALRLEFIGCRKVNPCHSNPCSNAATCVSDGVTYGCRCPAGFGGRDCNISMTVCTAPQALGMEHNKTFDSQISASSQNSPASGARLRGADGWRREDWDTDNPWFQVDFQQIVTVTAIQTQGQSVLETWVTSYMISYGYELVFLQEYSKTFTGNVDRETVRDELLSPFIVAQFIRIHPKTCYGNCGLRVEFIGCYAACGKTHALGMENNNIPDSAITSSPILQNHDAKLARLNLPYPIWTPYHNAGSWLQVRFPLLVKVVEILTQGRPNYDQWVLTYTVSFLFDGLYFHEYKENGVVKIFTGNTDRNTIVRQSLSPVIVAQFIRIYPKTWRDRAALRVEFVGCLQAYPCDSIPLNSSPPRRMCVNRGYSYEYQCLPGLGGKNCDINMTDCATPKPLGMENIASSSYVILDSQITASSEYDHLMLAHNGRLNLILAGNYGGWAPAANDLKNPWFQVDFLQVVTVTEIRTQGRAPGYDQYMESYTVSYGYNVEFLQEYNKVFPGNWDRSTVVGRPLSPAIVAQFIRIHPKTWNIYCVLRVEFVGCYRACNDSHRLGMENYAIQDSQISASSVYDSNFEPHHGRLNFEGLPPSVKGAWIPQDSDTSKWLQVDFIRIVTVTKIHTHGRFDSDQWVKTYTVSYSFEGERFNGYKENGALKIFSGNSDKETIVSHNFFPIIATRLIRIHPESCHGHCALRVGFDGCHQVYPCESNPCPHGQSCTDDKYSYSCHCPAGSFGANCALKVSGCKPSRPLGMQDGTILDSQLSASSQHNPGHSPANARLNFTGSHGIAGAWVPLDPSSDPEPWLQVDFLQIVSVTEIKTQGRYEGVEKTSSFAISYGNELPFLQKYKENNTVKIFPGNFDRNTIISHPLLPVIVARFIRIIPKTWSNRPALRLEFLGCDQVCNGPYPLGMESGRILDSQISASSMATKTLHPTHGRLNFRKSDSKLGSWAAENDDSNKWFQVDFLQMVTISAIITQGRQDANQWVKTYTVSFLFEGEHFGAYKENGQGKVFVGNVDNRTPVTQALSPNIMAQIIRIHPVTFEGRPAMRLEFVGCYPGPCGTDPHCNNGSCLLQPSGEKACECNIGYGGKLCEHSELDNMRCVTPVGVANHRKIIPDINMVASSYLNEDYRPEHGRLFNPVSAWCAHPRDDEPHFKIKFNTNMMITAVVTQGDPTGDNYVKKYKLTKCCFEPDRHVAVRSGQIFDGNSDSNSVSAVKFYPSLEASELLFHVVEFHGDYRCLRVEIYGCPNSTDPSNCFTTLGLSNQYPDDSFGATSFYDAFLSYNARLNGESAWCASGSDTAPALTIQARKSNTEIVGIMTQGYTTQQNHRYTQTYTFGDRNGKVYTSGGQNIFSGNYNGNSTVIHFLDSPVPLYSNDTALVIRPLEFYQARCLRVEMISCGKDDPCLTKPCGVGGTCVTKEDYSFYCQCRDGFYGETCSQGVCYEELEIHEDDVWASSDMHNGKGEHEYRLSGTEALCFEEDDTKLKMSLKLGGVKNVTGIGIGGHTDIGTEAFVRKFKFMTRNLSTDSWRQISVNGSTTLHGTKKSGSDRIDYILDTPILAYQVNFSFTEFANESMRCARVEVRGCDVDFCSIVGDVCKNNGSCREEYRKPYVCDCVPGFGGDHCETDICEEAACHLDAYCNQTTNFTCVCNDGLSGNGSYCIDLCNPSPCHPNATCLALNDLVVANCTCDEGFNGNGTYCTGYHEWGNWTSCRGTCGNGTQIRTRACIYPDELSCEGLQEEEKSCLLEPCAVNGNWSQWQAWSPCSVTCGSGVNMRNRSCTNPAPAYGGAECDGLPIEIADCDAPNICAGEGGFGEWTNWTTCSASCGDGYQNRTRTCEDAGLGCTGSASQGKPCLIKMCPVDGNYTEWGNWSECSKPCGPGEQIRKRECTNPKPAHGGKICEEPAEETKECVIKLLCEGDYGFTEWTAWSSCTTTCGTGSQSRSRNCTLENPGSSFCLGPSDETTECDPGPCPVDGGFSRWTNWTLCNAACGYGQSESSRTCSNPFPEHGGLECTGGTRKVKDCIIANCTGVFNFSPWSSWSTCSVSCATGVQSKTRFCLDSGGVGCNGTASATKECVLPDCPVDGGFTEWGYWSSCSVTCGSGMINRKRECTNPKPANNGSDCLGLDEELSACTMPEICPGSRGFTTWSLWSECNVPCSEGETFRTRNCTDATRETCEGEYKMNMSCYAGPCPVHGQYSDWFPWSSCSGYCGSGLKNRVRTCTNPEPAHGGSGCSGPNKEVEDCQHATECSGESGYTQWSMWSSCTQTCGNSTQIRTRTCNAGAPPEECSTTAVQKKPCDLGKCPVHGHWSEWSSWGSCSASCGSGGKYRKRSCTNPVPSYGGLPCYGSPDEVATCTMPDICSGEEEFSNWGNWGECSTTCGVGIRKRSRHCIVVPSYPPPEEDYCTLPTDQHQECYQEPCAVNGNFTTWTGWSDCSTTCGFGTRQRYRNCTNPAPAFGGSDCLGHLFEVLECTDAAPCPDDASFSSWSTWQQCSDECDGTTHKSRECTDVASNCLSPSNVSMACNTEPCAVNGSWSVWSSWSSCSKTCGHQEETRTRACNNPAPRNGGFDCSGNWFEVMPCSVYEYVRCPDPPPAEWSDWSWWTVCNASCAGGLQKRYRLCNNPPPTRGYPTCAGEADQITDCNVHPCPIHGNFTTWTDWTKCTVECGGGSQVRARLCANPEPKFGGMDCEGDRSQLRDCNTQPCPIHGGFTQWSPWTFCSKPCNTGYLQRERSCTNPTPMYGGRNCSGSSFESNTCNTAACIPVDIRLDVTFTSILLATSQLNDIKTRAETLIESAYDSHPPSVAFDSCSGDSNGRPKCVFMLTFQSIAEDELVVLQDKLREDSSETLLNSLSSLKIFSSPLTVQSRAVNSTEIEVTWLPLAPAAQTSDTSTLTGYIIFYKEHSSDSYQKIAVEPDSVEKTVEKLKKFTPYRIVVCPYSTNGNGVPSLPVEDKTLEDVPSMPPELISVESPSSTSLNITWNAVNQQYLHGVPRGYCVYYRAEGSSTSEMKNITSISQLNTTIAGLRPYTRYYLKVAAQTTPGCGAEAETDFLTQEDVPGEPPLVVTAQNSSSTSILVKWGDVRPDARNGIIRGFKVTYTRNGVTKTVDVNDGNARQLEINGLEIFKEYEIKVLAYTSVGDGPASTALEVYTDESTPSEAPLLVKAKNTSSTSIELEWQPISNTSHRGIFRGYRIYYRPANTKRKDKIIEVDTDTLQYELTNLFMWWWYEIRVGGYTRVGTGVTANVSVQTDEELPSRYPENIRGIAVTSTSMSFEWDKVLPGFLHGLLLGYNLTVRETNDFDNVVVQTILSPYDQSYYVDGLKKYTNYTIWVRAINSRGHGAVYGPGNINTTGEDGPEFPPDNIRVSTLAHISQLAIEWTRIPKEFHNGILRGYYIEYTAVVLAGEPVPKEKRVVQSVRIRGNRYASVLYDLQPGSTYEVVIFGYTIKNGTKSNATIGETCRCPKYIRANWWVIPPYTNISDLAEPGGIFFTITRLTLDSLCGTCVNGHGRTEFCYSEGCDKKRRRRSTSNSYQKNSLQAVANNINGDCEFSFPVQGNKYMTTYGGVFPYISVIDAPGSAYFTVKNVPSTAEVVVNASLNCIPMVALMSLFAWTAGIIIWILERNNNNEQFPSSFTKGVPEGFWWAFISMTTVGYGDRFPLTTPGRLFSIIWILMGLVIISIVTGGIVTSITSVLVVQEDKIYGAQVGAVVNSSEYSKAIRQNADVIGFNNIEEIIDALENKKIAGALIDIYAAATKKHLLQTGDIQLNRMIQYPTGYGIVLSGNMAKAAPLFRDILGIKKAEVSQIIEENTETISQDRNLAEEAKEKSSGLFDPTAEAFRSSFNITIALLAAAIIAGLIWHFGVYRRREKEKEKKLEELRNMIPQFRVMEFLKSSGRTQLEKFTKQLHEELAALRKKQIRERKKTFLYKTEKARRKRATENSLIMRRSVSRVSPEVNEGIDVVELDRTSPRQSSLSVFSEFRKQKTAKVTPVGESSNRGLHVSVETLN